MFERFTQRARAVLVHAQEEARQLRHPFIGTEHILLGVLAEGEGLGAKALRELGVELGAARAAVVEIISTGDWTPDKKAPPFTPRAKKVLELALREALQLGHNYIGTEHLLLGLVREGEGVAAQVLVELGVDLSRVRQHVVSLLSGSGREAKSTPAGREVTVAARVRAGGDPVGSHHLLLGLLDTGDGLGAQVLESFGVTLEAAQARIDEMGTKGTADELPRRRLRRRVDLGPGISLTVDEDQLEETGQSLGDELSRDELSRIIGILQEHLRSRDEGNGSGAEPGARDTGEG